MEVPAGQFKAHCLKLIDEVQTKRMEVVVTKRGKPVARLVPLEDAPMSRLFGCLKGTVTILGDIILPVEEEWESDDPR